MIFAAYFLALLSLLLNASLFLRLRPPWNFMVAMFQIVAVDFSPFLIILGLGGAALGWLEEAPVAVAAGLLAAAISAAYIYLVHAAQKLAQQGS